MTGDPVLCIPWAASKCGSKIDRLGVIPEVEMELDRLEIRSATFRDGKALVRTIEQINAETEFLAEPGQPVPWADHAEQCLHNLQRTASGIYILAVHGGVPVGYLGAFVNQLVRLRRVLFVHHVGVRQAFQGYGIGNRLFEALEVWARARRTRRLELRVDEDNLRALALYRRRGFRIEGRITDAIRLGNRWHSHYWMGRVLAGADPEPGWRETELEVSQRHEGARVELREPRSEDAAILVEWERKLLTGSPFHLKLPTEVSGFALDRAADVGWKDRFLLAAFAPYGQVVGVVEAWTDPGVRIRHDAHFRLNVLSDWYGNGVGRNLAGHVESWARGLGIHRLTTWTVAHNARGLRFAERFGFRREVLVPDYAVIDGRSVSFVGLGKILNAQRS